MRSPINIIKIIFNVVLGGMLIFGGVKKFENRVRHQQNHRKSKDLEPNDTGELLQMTGLLVINLLLISFGYRYRKPMLLDKTIFKFG